MTPATTRPIEATGSTTSTDRRETQSTVRTAVPSGWYDPDGAAWEAEVLPASEALRATPMRPQIHFDGVDSGTEN